MTNAFASLGFDPRPHLDPEKIKSRYHELAATAHPDRAGGSGAGLSALNEARQILSSPPRRLRHLAVLMFPDEPETKTADPDWTVFSTVADVCQRIAAWHSRRASSGSALQTSLLLLQRAPLEADWKKAHDLVETSGARLDATLTALDARWPLVPATELFDLAARWTFYDRWTASLAEARAQLDGA